MIPSHNERARTVARLTRPYHRAGDTLIDMSVLMVHDDADFQRNGDKGGETIRARHVWSAPRTMARGAAPCV
jgi:hypothetical protein